MVTLYEFPYALRKPSANAQEVFNAKKQSHSTTKVVTNVGGGCLVQPEGNVSNRKIGKLDLAKDLVWSWFRGQSNMPRFAIDELNSIPAEWAFTTFCRF